MKNIKFNKKILNITKKELESKWWHRLARVIIWTIISIFSFYLLLVMLKESEEIWGIITIILVCASLIYLLLRLIYYIILYIVYGCKKKQ